jgi:hypothetical protein
MKTENDIGYPETSNPITWPTIQQQTEYWNKKEGEELERVSRLQEAESDELSRTNVELNNYLKLASKIDHITSQRDELVAVLKEILDFTENRKLLDLLRRGIGTKTTHGITIQKASDLVAASNPQEQAPTTAKTLTQEEIEEREQASCEIYDEREREWSLRE